MIKYETYPLGLANEWQKQQDRRSLYQCRLASLLSQDMKDSTLEEHFRDCIDDASVNIHFLEIMDAWEVDSFTRSHHPIDHGGSVRRTPQASMR